VVRWSFLLLGLALVSLGWYGRRTLHAPRPLSLEEARGRLDCDPAELVRLRARPAAGPRWYNLVANDDVAHVPERLSRFSPRDGVPLLGPGAPPPGQWGSFLGLDVSADSPLSPDVLTLKGDRHTKFGGLDIHSASRRFLARLSAGRDLWVLSPTFEKVLHGPLDDPDADPKVRAWVARHRFKGVLHRLKDYSIENVTPADIERELRGRPGGNPPDLAAAWLIVEKESAWHRSAGGWHFYVPAEGSDARVWVQVSLAEEEEFASWRERAGDELTGVWRPAGSHAFVPAEAGVAGGVALLQTGPQAVERFREEQWQRHWGRSSLWGGAGLLLLAGLLFAARRVRRRYFRPGVPAFLVPYRRYLVPESSAWRAVRVVLGCLALLVAGAGAVYSLLANDALRHPGRVPDGMAPLLLGGLCVSGVACPLALVFAYRLLGRGAVTVLRNDPRPPLLYRSFREQAAGVLPRPLPADPGGALFLGFGPGWEPELLGAGTPSLASSLRRLLTGSAAPAAVREALNPVLRRLGLKARAMPPQFREWVLLALGGLLLLILLGLGVLLALARPAG
jgi:hypothetical protein